MKLRNMTSLFLEREGELLCLYRIGSRVADHLYIGSAGGHFEEGELNDPRACVLRELREELGLGEEDLLGLTMRYALLRLKNGELRQNYYFFARLKEEKKLQSNDGVLRWVPYDEMEELPMPASAKFMIQHYIKEGRFTNKIYGAVTRETGTRFVELAEF